MRPRRTSIRTRALVVGLLAVVLTTAACTGGESSSDPSSPTPSARPYAARPNVVFVLTDDLSLNLVRYMPHVTALAAAGMTFSNYTVTDSLCCPSRSSILTGKFPHNTHVFTNGPPGGGMEIFNKYGGPQASYGTALQRAGYRTALMGKYLNGYEVGAKAASSGLPDNYVPQGWSTWAAGAGAYRNFAYNLNQDGRIVSYGRSPKDYLTRVITKLGVEFIEDSVRDRKPFALELSTYSPHSPYTPDPIDADSFLTLEAPRGPSYNRKPVDAPAWLERLPASLSTATRAWIDRVFVKRVEAVQSVDRAIGSLEAALRRTGQWKNTVFVFSSDNGYHLGEHGLREGKRTAFDTDVHVPLVVAGPGIAPGTTDDHVVQNIDLAPTFQQLAGLTVPGTVDGRSLVPLLQGRAGRAVEWRTRALVEHRGEGNPAGDPDRQPVASGNPPTYGSLRGPDWTYVRYSDGEHEYYDRGADPDELTNLAGTLSPARTAALDRQLDALESCAGSAQCWAAGRPQRS